MKNDIFPQKLTLETAKKYQQNLVGSLILEDDFNIELNNVGGAALHARRQFITASVATFKTNPDLKKFEVFDESTVVEKADCPVVPGFESFRDGAILAKILSSMTKPDLLFVEGYGINHPHKLGLASHVGLALDIPAIAVGRDLISGIIGTVSGQDVILEDDGVRGAVLKKGRIKLYVAPGHRISWETALDLAKKCTKSIYPEPLKIVQDNMIKSVKDSLKI